MSDLDTFRLLVSDFYDSVGAVRNKAEMDNHAATLQAAGYIRDADGEYRSASGETATQFLSDLLVYGSRSIGAATQAPVDDRAKYDGLTKADYDALPYHKKAEIRDKVDGPARAKWMDRVKQGGLPPGMTADTFAKLSPEEKIAAANEATRVANGWATGGFMAGGANG
ncbi:hypothetical protein [Methylocystis sp. S23]